MKLQKGEHKTPKQKIKLIGEVKNVLRKRYEGHHEERERRR